VVSDSPHRHDRFKCEVGAPRLAKFLGESNEKPFRPTDGAEPIRVLIPDYVPHELCAELVNDPIDRIEQLCRVLNSHTAETIHLGRSLIRLTVEGDEPCAGAPRRGYRRVQWIEKALAG